MALNKRCPKCTETGHDSDSSHLYLMRDGETWHCDHAKYHLDGEKYYQRAGVQVNMTGEQKEDEPYAGASSMAELFGGVMADEPVPSPASTGGHFQELVAKPVPVGATEGPVTKTYRGIEASTYRHFGVTGVYSGTDLLELVSPLFEVEKGTKLADKVRVITTKDFRVRNGKTAGTAVQLFGQSVFTGSKRLVICEGELDAMSAWQMFQGDKYGKHISVVSLPFGAKVGPLLDNPKYLAKFKDITICVDQDSAGEDVSRDIALLLPTAKFMEFSEKDANDMMENGKESEFISAYWSAEERRPDTVVTIGDIMGDIMKKPIMGKPWPWPTLTKKTYGRNPGQGIYVGAGVKQGKSEFINQVVAFDIGNKDKIAVLKFEEPPPQTVKKVAGKLDGTFYHKPDILYPDADLENRALSMEPYLLMYPAFGQATWELTKSFIRYAALSGCTTIIIDPLTKLTNTMTSSDTETELRKVSDELACMAMDLGFFYIVTCHLKAPANGPPHERGGKVNSNQFRGSRAMMENTYYMLGIERNRDPDLSEDEQNTSTFVLLEDRNFGNSAKFPVFYDKTDQSYLEPALSGGGMFT